jgi:hypothetical protein
VSEEQHTDGAETEAVDYETPSVEDLGTTEGPTVTSAGASNQ